MARRVESKHPLFFSGSTGQLYVSSGPSDDYLEISLHEDESADCSPLRRLAGLLDGRDDLAVAFHGGAVPVVSITALYVNDAPRKSMPPVERVADILACLLRAEPRLGFGDLLPRANQATEPTPMSSSVAPSAEVQCTEEPICETPAAPAPGTATRAGSAERLARARDLAARGQLHKALRILDDLLREAPRLFEAEELATEIRLLEKREKRANREARNPQAHLEAGFSYLQLGRDRDAANSLRRASQLDTNLYLAHLLLGVALHKQGDLIQALRAYERARRIQPEDNVPRDLLAALERGEPSCGLVETGRERRQSEARPPRYRLAWAG